jgi:hypothetical protein
MTPVSMSSDDRFDRWPSCYMLCVSISDHSLDWTRSKVLNRIHSCDRFGHDVMFRMGFGGRNCPDTFCKIVHSE